MEEAAVELARRLVGMDTRNPPGGEGECARFLGGLLRRAGLAVSYHDFAPGRTSLVARLEGDGPPLCLSGHLDTVPAEGVWQHEPLSPRVADGWLYGLGASDMKGGVAALVSAVQRAAEPWRGRRPRRGLVVVLSAGEETGCQGARHLAESGALGRAGALLVAEPTGLRPMRGHKGAAWLRAVTRGKSAHGSRPREGDNAVYKAARAVCRLAEYRFSLPPHPLLGEPTLNVGTIRGGVKPNLVPARAEFTVDLRLLPGQEVDQVVAELERVLGPEVELSLELAAAAVWSEGDDPWSRRVCRVTAELGGDARPPGGLSYFTDASALVPALGGPPVVILGPGTMAHQPDERCPLEQIRAATRIYAELVRRWLAGEED